MADDVADGHRPLSYAVVHSYVAAFVAVRSCVAGPVDPDRAAYAFLVERPMDHLDLVAAVPRHPAAVGPDFPPAAATAVVPAAVDRQVVVVVMAATIQVDRPAADTDCVVIGRPACPATAGPSLGWAPAVAASAHFVVVMAMPSLNHYHA